jgi:phage recombination protein Bet
MMPSAPAPATVRVTDNPLISGYLKWTASEIRLILNSVARDDSVAEICFFLTVADRQRLDPLLRQIYYVKRKANEPGTIQVGIDGYRLIADRTGKYAGSDDPEFGPEVTVNGVTGPEWARVTVWKFVQGVRCPFTATAYLAEYAQGYMYRSRPRGMTGKCAEALALRKAFPAELSGIYTKEEMPDHDDAVSVSIITGEVEEAFPSVTHEDAAKVAPVRSDGPKRLNELPSERRTKFNELWSEQFQQARALGLTVESIPDTALETEASARLRELTQMVSRARAERGEATS